MQSKYFILIVGGMLLLFGCGGGGYVQTEGQLDWSSSPQRPGWLSLEPESKGDRYIFIGLSNKFATEKEAREDASRSAVANVVKYISTDVRNDYQKLVTSAGLSSDIIDPTVAVRNFEQQLSSAVARRIKPQEWYLEKYHQKGPTGTESYWLAYVLADVPKSDVEEVIKQQTARQQELLNINQTLTGKLAEINELIQESETLKGTNPNQALLKYQTALKIAENTKNLALTYPETGKLAGRIDETLKTIQTKINALAGNPETALLMKLSTLIKPPAKPVSVAVAKVNYQETEMSSEFGNYLAGKLESLMGQQKDLYKVVAQKVFQEQLKKGPLSVEDCLGGRFKKDEQPVLAEINALMFGRSWEKDETVEIKLDLIEIGTGTVLGSATVELSKKLFPAKMAYKPDNIQIAHQGLSAFASDEKGNKTFKIKVWPDKGEGAIYKEGEPIFFHFRSDKDCYVYLYHMDAAGKVKILFPNEFSNDNKIKANQVYTFPNDEMGFDFTITPPLGAEMVKAIASLQPLKNVDITNIKDFKELGQIGQTNVREVITRSIEAVPREAYAEGGCVITSIK